MGFGVEILGNAVGSRIAAASTGAIAAWVLTNVRDWLNKPRLSMVIAQAAGSLVETEDNAGNQTKYARLVIRNKGRTLAKKLLRRH